MDIEKVDPTLRPIVTKFPRFNMERPFVRWGTATLSGLIPGHNTVGVKRSVVKDKGVKVRVFQPDNATGSALLWIHGGGLIGGAARQDDRHCGETAAALGVTVVSVSYRLAPKYPFPAALDDCYAAFAWVQTHAERLHIDPKRLVIGGQSAGGGLAATLVQRLVDEGVELAGQWLFCPMLDDRTAADRSRDADDHLIWNNRSNLVGWTSYLGQSAFGDTVAPYAVAARREDVTGLPPTWIYTSDIELFAQEDREYARRLEAAGVDVVLDVIHGAPHGFEFWAPHTALAIGLIERARQWLSERLG